MRAKVLEYVENIISPIERDQEVTTREIALVRLRELGLDDFGALLLSMPNDRYPKLSGLLPQMASEEVQQNWTGGSGLPLLRLTCNFVRSTAYNFTRLTKHDLTDATILDYGCGYGRMLRIMSYFTSEKNLYGVDPWDRSLEECLKCGLTENIFLSHYLPLDLPLGNTKFDLIYAFSVFTHTSQRATYASLNALRQYISSNGLLVITIRPVEYWNAFEGLADELRKDLIRRHRSEGFAFWPHNRPPIDGDITYGETSMTLDWIRQNAGRWCVAGIDRSLDDGLQIYVFLRPAPDGRIKVGLRTRLRRLRGFVPRQRKHHKR
jgi:SAM-dependent methyltransferase